MRLTNRLAGAATANPAFGVDVPSQMNNAMHRIMRMFAPLEIETYIEPLARNQVDLRD